MFNKDGYIIPEKKVIPVKEWQSLSDDEIRDIYKNYQRGYYEEDFFNFARAIEQALREKNHAD